MLTPVLTNRFKKELVLMQKRGMDMAKLREVMELIETEQPLPERCHTHPLRGEWAGCLDSHVFNDNWVLIYEIDRDAGEVIFHRTGSHSDLF